MRLKMRPKHTTRLKFTLLLVVFIFTSISTALGISSSLSLLNQAKDEYRKGRYSLASSLYDKAINGGADDGYIYYNLANTQYRLKQYGKAIANYRRALEQYPRDPNIKANLNLAREHAVDKIKAKNSITSIINILSPASILSTYEKQFLFFITYFLFWIILAVYMIKKTALPKTLCIFSFIICIYTSILAFGTRKGFDGSPELALSPSAQTIKSAVVVKKEVKVYSGNSETFQVVFLLHDGAEVLAGESREKWVQVFLPEEKQGWLKKDSLDIL